MSSCPNCGAPNFNKVKEGDACEACGYVNTKFKEDSSGILVFCEGCGFHRSTYCDEHPREKQKVK